MDALIQIIAMLQVRRNLAEDPAMLSIPCPQIVPLQAGHLRFGSLPFNFMPVLIPGFLKILVMILLRADRGFLASAMGDKAMKALSMRAG
jgi:hypothetical protein